MSRHLPAEKKFCEGNPHEQLAVKRDRTRDSPVEKPFCRSAQGRGPWLQSIASRQKGVLEWNSKVQGRASARSPDCHWKTRPERSIRRQALHTLNRTWREHTRILPLAWYHETQG